jgi:hypothetical protein
MNGEFSVERERTLPMPICRYCGQPIRFRMLEGQCVPMGCDCSNQEIEPGLLTSRLAKCFPARCPICGGEAFFIRHNGGSAWFEELGWPWEKHPCFVRDAEASLITEARSRFQEAEDSKPLVGVVVSGKEVAGREEGDNRFWLSIDRGRAGQLPVITSGQGSLNILVGSLVVINPATSVLSGGDGVERQILEGFGSARTFGCLKGSKSANRPTGSIDSVRDSVKIKRVASSTQVREFQADLEQLSQLYQRRRLTVEEYGSLLVYLTEMRDVFCTIRKLSRVDQRRDFIASVRGRLSRRCQKTRVSELLASAVMRIVEKDMNLLVEGFERVIRILDSLDFRQDIEIDGRRLQGDELSTVSHGWAMERLEFARVALRSIGECKSLEKEAKGIAAETGVGWNFVEDRLLTSCDS